MLTLTERTPLHVPDLHVFEQNGITYAVDAEAPNWSALDARAAEVVKEIRGEQGIAFGALVARYADRHHLEAGKAWLHVHDFLSSLGRASMLFDAPVKRETYGG